MKITELEENLDGLINNILELEDTESIDIKELSYDDKLLFMKRVFIEKNLVNSSILLNIYTLIKSSNSLDDALFANENIYFNNIEEYLDIKFDLKADIIKFNKELIEYFIAVLKGVGIFESDGQDRCINIPLIYQRILFITDFYTLSRIMFKVAEIDFGIIPPALNATAILGTLSEKFSLGSELLKIFKLDQGATQGD
jgi:hypothetical protein